jgi:hypothetical protein
MYIWWANFSNAYLIGIADRQPVRIFTGRLYSKVIYSNSLRYNGLVLTIGLERWVDSYIKYALIHRHHICLVHKFQGWPSTTR